MSTVGALTSPSPRQRTGTAPPAAAAAQGFASLLARMGGSPDGAAGSVDPATTRAPGAAPLVAAADVLAQDTTEPGDATEADAGREALGQDTGTAATAVPTSLLAVLQQTAGALAPVVRDTAPPADGTAAVTTGGPNGVSTTTTPAAGMRLSGSLTSAATAPTEPAQPGAAPAAPAAGDAGTGPGLTGTTTSPPTATALRTTPPVVDGVEPATAQDGTSTAATPTTTAPTTTTPAATTPAVGTDSSADGQGACQDTPKEEAPGETAPTPARAAAAGAVATPGGTAGSGGSAEGHAVGTTPAGPTLPVAVAAEADETGTASTDAPAAAVVKALAAPTTDLSSALAAAVPAATPAEVRAPAPAAAPPAAAPPPPAAQLAQALGPVLQGPDGSYSLSLELYPEELGAVQVEVLLRGGEIRLALHAADDSAQAALRAALPDLRADLEASGLSPAALSVDGGRPEQSSREHPSRSPQSPPRPDPGSGPAADAALPRTTTSSPDAALDLRM